MKLPKKERIRCSKRIYKSLDGLISIEKLMGCLKNYYFYTEVKQNPNFQKYLQQCKQYLKAIELAINGVNYKEISKLCVVPLPTVNGWLNGRKPYLILLSQSLPIKKPPYGKWLPLRIKTYAKPIDFIIVPEKISNYNDIVFLLKQLSIEDDLESKEKALGYVMGMLVSDLSKPKGYDISHQALLALTRRYNWNLEIGNSLCLYFKKIGIKAKRIKDNDKIRKREPHGTFRWISEKTPFITWLIRVCLGLKKNEVTTFDKVNMKWILKTPTTFRKAFIQGICDGDGSAHNFRRVEISCDPNQKFIIELLKTFKIKSRIDGDSVVIINNTSLLRASEIPVFMHAKGRVHKLDKIRKMIQNPQKPGNGSNVKIRERIIELRKQGYSAGTISETIFDEFGKGIHPSSIYRTQKTFIHPKQIYT